jgi:peptidoglycan/xylan/chitin deacetylase (PgdA/CDA1 family)
MRGLLKRPVERALASSVVGSITRKRVSGRKRLILAYHGISPVGEEPSGERALFVSQRDFAAQLDVLMSIADVAPLGRLDELGDGRPRVAITFDDAYRGAVREGVRELILRGFSATIFVAPARLNGHTFWWDALAHGAEALEEKVRSHALRSLDGCDEKVRAWAAGANLESSHRLPSYARSATTSELRDAVSMPGITVASHGWSHANLAALPASEVASELERSREWLRSEFGAKAIPWLSYPYGLSSEETRRAAAMASYTDAVTIGGGWHARTRATAFARPRLSIPGKLSIAGFRARILGAIRP